MIQLELAVPGMVDGDPADVERQVLADLQSLTDPLADYIDQATKQLANAERTRILTDSPAMDGEALAQAYRESYRAGAITRLLGAARAMCAAVQEMQ